MADGPGSRSGDAAPLVDANLLLWAHHRQFPMNEAARAWWGHLLSEQALVGIPWPSILAFVRISTHARALEHPLDTRTAWDTVEGWLDRPNVWIPTPTERHRSILGPLLRTGNASGNHVPDAHLAALAMEWGLELLTADRDFARYRGLRWHDPLAHG